MSWQDQIKGDPLPWLLEDSDPGARYLALRDLLGGPEDGRELRQARAEAHAKGPIATILAAMEEEKGTSFDPELIEHFLLCLPSLKQIQKRYKDEAESS